MLDKTVFSDTAQVGRGSQVHLGRGATHTRTPPLLSTADALGRFFQAAPRVTSAHDDRSRSALPPLYRCEPRSGLFRRVARRHRLAGRGVRSAILLLLRR
jgi:hypothetical protein